MQRERRHAVKKKQSRMLAPKNDPRKGSHAPDPTPYWKGERANQQVAKVVVWMAADLVRNCDTFSRAALGMLAATLMTSRAPYFLCRCQAWRVQRRIEDELTRVEGISRV
jgi:hypothetical protein